MNKILVNEDIIRIQELMNVSKKLNLIGDKLNTNLVLESNVIIKPFRKGIQHLTDIFDNKMSYFDNKIGKYIVNGLSIGQDIFDDMVNKLNVDKNLDNFTDIQRKIVGKILKSETLYDELFADELAADLLSLPEYIGKTKEEVLEDLAIKLFAASDEGKGGKKLDDVLVDAYTDKSETPPKTYWEYVELMKEYWRKKIDGLPDYKKAPYKKGANVTGLEKAADYEMRLVSWVRENVGNLFKSRQKIEKECVELIDRIKRKNEGGENIGDDLNKLFDKIITLKGSPTEDIKKLFQQYLTENPDLKDIPAYIEWAKKNDLEGFISQVAASTSDATTNVIIYRLLSEIEGIIPVYFERLRKPDADYFDIKLSGRNWIRRKTWGLIWKDGLTPREIRLLRAQQGWKGWLVDDFLVKAVLGLVIYPMVGDTIIDAVLNDPILESKDRLTDVFKKICNSSKDTEVSGNTIFCTSIFTELNNLQAQTEDSLIKRIKNIIPDIISQFDGYDLVPSDIDDTIGKFFEFLDNRGRTLDQKSIVTVVNEWLDREKVDPNNPVYARLKELGIDVDDSNYQEQVDKAIERLKGEAEGMTLNKTEEDLMKQFPNLNRWIWSDETGMELIGDGSKQFTVKEYPSGKIYNANKTPEGTWVWVLDDGREFDIGDGSKPQLLQQRPTDPNISAGGEESTGILTNSEAERIGFDLNKVLNALRYQYNDRSAQIYDTNNDNKVIIFYNGYYLFAEKINNKWYWNGDSSNLVYGGEGSTGEENQGETAPRESYINKKRMINQVNTKTLKESIRNKVLLKHEEKKYKIKKINENLRKFEENFYYGDYNKFFDKMFKLAESYKKSKLYLNEDDNVTFDSALIQSGLFKGQEDRMKQEFSNYVSKNLGLKGEVRRNFEDKVSNYPFNDIGQLFTDTDKMIDMIYKSFSDSISNDSSTPDNFISVLQSTIKPYLKTADFERNVKSNLASVSEPIMNKARKKVDNLVMKIKELLAKEESKS